MRKKDNEKKFRIYYFDNIKGLLIILAVLYHSVSVGNDVYKFNDDFILPILFFLIPGFIFITGYFCGKSKHSPLKNALKMFIIYLIAQVIFTFYFTDVLHVLNKPYDFLIPRYTLWYLLTCSFCYLLSIPFKKLDLKKALIMSVSISLIVGFFDDIGEIMSISRTITMLPFFLLGMKIDDKTFFEKIKSKRTLFVILAVLIYAFYMVDTNVLTNSIVYGKYSYNMIYSSEIEGFIKRALMYIIYSIFTGAIFSCIPKQKTILATLGSKTLVIYIMHGLILKTLYVIMPFPKNELIGTLLLFLISFILSVLIAYLYEKIKKTIINLLKKKK